MVTTVIKRVKNDGELMKFHKFPSDVIYIPVMRIIS